MEKKDKHDSSQQSEVGHQKFSNENRKSSIFYECF